MRGRSHPFGNGPSRLQGAPVRDLGNYYGANVASWWVPFPGAKGNIANLAHGYPAIVRGTPDPLVTVANRDDVGIVPQGAIIDTDPVAGATSNAKGVGYHRVFNRQGTTQAGNHDWKGHLTILLWWRPTRASATVGGDTQHVGDTDGTDLFAVYQNFKDTNGTAAVTAGWCSYRPKDSGNSNRVQNLNFAFQASPTPWMIAVCTINRSGGGSVYANVTAAGAPLQRLIFQASGTVASFTGAWGNCVLGTANIYPYGSLGATSTFCQWKTYMVLPDVYIQNESQANDLAWRVQQALQGGIRRPSLNLVAASDVRRARSLLGAGA